MTPASAVGEDPSRPQSRHVDVQPLHVRYLAAQDNDVWIEHVDHMREAARELLLVDRERCCITRVWRSRRA